MLFPFMGMNGCGNILGGYTSFTYKTLIKSQNPIGYYSFEESSGTIAYDSSDSSNHSNFNGSAVIEKNKTGKNGNCFNFILDSWLTPTTPINLGSNWTISFWLKLPIPNDGNWKTIARGTIDHQVIFDQFTNDYGIYVSGFQTSGINADNLSAGWHHFATVGSATETSFYVDGTFRSTINFGTTDTVNTIGNYTDGAQPAYMLDEIAFFNKALTATEIRNQFFAP